MTTSTQTSPLPRLHPRATTAHRSAPPAVRGGTKRVVYGPYPPFDLSVPQDDVDVPRRVNPIAPPLSKQRIDASWETVEQHWHNDSRRLVMQQREHTRYHSAWAKAFNGSPAHQEAYRRHFRLALKQQIEEREGQRRQGFKERAQESQKAMDHDRHCQHTDSQHCVTKLNYLKTFRDHNKQRMDSERQKRRAERLQQQLKERKILRYNPVNWSGTLK